MLTTISRSSRATAPTTPVTVLSTGAPSTLTVTPTTSTCPPATSSLPSTARRPSTSTGLSAVTSASAAPSTCRTTSTPGTRLACASETTTTRSWRLRVTKAVAAPLSTSRLAKSNVGKCQRWVDGRELEGEECLAYGPFARGILFLVARFDTVVSVVVRSADSPYIAQSISRVDDMSCSHPKPRPLFFFIYVFLQMLQTDPYAKSCVSH